MWGRHRFASPFVDCRQSGNYPETGLGEIDGDLPEADCGPASRNSPSAHITQNLPSFRSGAIDCLKPTLVIHFTEEKVERALDSDAQNGREPPRFGFPGCCDC